MYEDAAALARVRLDPQDPQAVELLSEWGAVLERRGQFEVAAKWWVLRFASICV
jgi:hypothetical protein